MTAVWYEAKLNVLRCLKSFAWAPECPWRSHQNTETKKAQVNKLYSEMRGRKIYFPISVQDEIDRGPKCAENKKCTI